MGSNRGPWSGGPWNRDGMGWGGGRNNPWDWGPMDKDRWTDGPWNQDFPWQKNRSFRGWGPVPEKRRGIAPPPRFARPPAPPKAPAADAKPAAPVPAAPQTN